jgi:hypothetical protein
MQDVGIFGYSRKNLTAEDLRSIIALTLTCRIDHQYGSLITLRVSIINFIELCGRMVKMSEHFYIWLAQEDASN